MTIEIITKYYDRYVLSKERMTWYAWIAVAPAMFGGPTTYEKFEGVLKEWPVVEVAGVETLSTPNIEEYIQAWREIPDEPEQQTNVPELPLVSGTSIPTDTKPNAPKNDDSDVSVPSASQVPDSGTDWIK